MRQPKGDSIPYHVMVLTYWDSEDPLVTNATLPYVGEIRKALPPGSEIHLVTLNKQRAGKEHRLFIDGVVHHVYKYHPFGVKALLTMLLLVTRLIKLVLIKRIQTVHAWCTPAGMVGYLVALVTGVSLVIDSYEPHAEAMVESGAWKAKGMAYRVLFLFEKLQTRQAAAVVALTEGMRDYSLRKYGRLPNKFYVRPTCVDLTRFPMKLELYQDRTPDRNRDGKVVAVYAGKFGGMYLKEEVFDLFRIGRKQWGRRFHVMLLTAHSAEELLPLIEKAGLPPSMFTIRWAEPEELAENLALADWALTPVKPVPTKRYCSPIKDGEYWAMGLPIMITKDISDDSDIIRERDIGAIIESLDDVGYRAAVSKMDGLLQRHSRKEWFDHIRPIAKEYRGYLIAERVYQELYDDLMMKL